MEQTPKGSSEGKISTSFQDTSKQVCERDYRIAGDWVRLPRSFPVICYTFNKQDEEMNSDS